ncbi:MAG: hypothetical protein H7Y42_05340 [Chitinophagaceae bacterium]|nr:hypothetical protein [Chitinophagaceae bacterium]
MKPYAIMLQTDQDDKLLTESVIAEIQGAPPLIFIASFGELADVVEKFGQPTVILINDTFSHTASEQLRLLKSNSEYGHIPVVVLGEMVTDEYIKRYYRAGASTYIIKPSSLGGTKKKIEGFFRYWFEVATV